ncbi:MAG: TIGR00266 family protein [Chloroflexi bacterium]|nr:TIGR00266 family protein [Chloroflexota bacterium]
MQVQILYAPSYSLAIAQLSSNESLIAEAGAMVSMSGGVQIETKARGGLLGGLARSFLGGESFFMNTFVAGPSGGEVTLASALPGDLIHMQLQGHSILAQSGSFVASGPGVTVDTKWGGAKSFFAGEGLFLLRIHGQGDLILSSYGAIHARDLAPGESYIVDTGHIVAFQEGMAYGVKKLGGLKSLFFSGEGLVAEFQGPGRVWIQTRSPGALLEWLAPQITKKSSD